MKCCNLLEVRQLFLTFFTGLLSFNLQVRNIISSKVASKRFAALQTYFFVNLYYKFQSSCFVETLFVSASVDLTFQIFQSEPLLSWNAYMRCLPKRKQSETCKGGRKRTIHITSVLPFKLRILKRKDKGPKYHLCKSFDVSWSCISNNKVSIYFASLL